MRVFVAILPLLFVSGALGQYGRPAKDDYEDTGYQGGAAKSNGYAPSTPSYSGHQGGYAAPAPASRPSFNAGYQAPAAAPQAHHGAAAAGGHDDQYDVGGSAWEPYSFSYTAEDPEGSHSHTAQGDAQGRITGQYTIQLADGRMRTVKYTADENGYRADIITNELGTESKNPADVTIQSSAPTGEEAAHQSNSQYRSQAGSQGGYSGGSAAAPQSNGYSNGHHAAPAPAVADHNAGYAQSGADYSNGHHEAAAPAAPRRRRPSSYGR